MRRFPLFLAAVVGVALLMPEWPSAQTAPPLHLNPVIVFHQIHRERAWSGQRRH